MFDKTKTLRNQYVIVIRAGSRLRFEPNERLQINVNIDGQNIVLTFQTRYIDEGFEALVPRELWIDARGPAVSLNSAVIAFTNAAMFFTTIISFCVNGDAGDCRFHIAYDNTPGQAEREFFEQFVEDERGMPHPSRRIKPSAITSVIDVLGSHTHTDRLRRAIIQYVLALKYWSKGEEILAVAHLYMGMETLVPVVRKNELDKHNYNTTQELADYWGIPLKELDSKIKKEILFEKDQECHRYAKKASDGVEHGFLGFDEIRPLAINIRDKTAEYLRRAIIKLLQLPAEVEQELLKSTYQKPIGTEGYIRYLRGYLLSNHDRLASEGNEYPLVEWRFQVTSFTRTDNNELRLSISQDMTPRLGEGVTFRPESVEIYGPEGVIPSSPLERQNLEAQIIPKEDLKYVQVQGKDLISLLEEALKDGGLEEIKVRTKEGNVLIIKPEPIENTAKL